jgi:hypothetical protein
VFEAPSGHRLFQRRVGHADVAAQAPELTYGIEDPRLPRTPDSCTNPP